MEQLDRNGQAELLVSFDERDVQAVAASLRASGRMAVDSEDIIREKSRLYGKKKSRALARRPA